MANRSEVNNFHFMSDSTPAPSTPKTVRATAFVMAGLPVLALVASAIMKFLKPAAVMQGFAHLGYPESSVFALGALELICTVLYLVPRTSVLGAILLTGYLGGATASTFRVGDAWIATVLLGVLLWGSLFLRDPRLRVLIPFRREQR
jgi:hypothetical protein